MLDTFVPLPRLAASTKENGFAPMPPKIFAQATHQPASHAPCREPVLTLRREGEKVTSIHIECACGQVIDLACDY